MTGYRDESFAIPTAVKDAAEHERRSKAEEIVDWAEAQHPTTVPRSIPDYIAYREALICAALEGMTERRAA